MSIRLRSGLLLVAMVLALAPAAGPGQGSRAEAASAGPRLLEANSTHLVFELSVPLPQVEPVPVRAQVYDRFTIPGYAAFGQAGQPELPGTGILIGIPPEGDITVRILEKQVEDLPGITTIYPVPTWVPVEGAADSSPEAPGSLVPQVVPDGRIYAEDALWPADLVAVDEIGWVRQQRVARLAVHPVQVNPARGLVRAARYLRVEVTFSGTPALAAAPALPDAFDPLLEAQLLNYDRSRSWRLSRQEPAQLQSGEQTPRPGDTSRTWLKLVVRAAGLYRVTADDLRRAGVPGMASANPTLLQVWRNGRQVPADFLGDLDGTFGPGEALAFYANVQPSIFSLDTIYWLTVGDQPGSRMASLNGTPWGLSPQTAVPATVRLEEDLIYRTDLPSGPTPSDPRWYWDKISSFGIGSKNLQVTLPAALSSGYTATLRARFIGISSLADVAPDHHLRWEINGRVIGDMTWDGAEPLVGTLSFPAAWLTAGDNQLRVVLPRERPEIRQDESYLDWVEITYQRSTQQVQDVLAFRVEGTGRRDVAIQTFSGTDVLLYDVTDGEAPRRVQGLAIVDAATSVPTALVATAVVDPAALSHRMHLPLVTLGHRSGAFAMRFGVELSSPRQFVATRSASLRAVDQFIVDRGSNWRSSDHLVDYLLISHGSLLPAAQTLATHRQSRGLAVAVVDVQDVYDEFGNGETNPAAIRDFVAYAYQNWRAPALAYVLLMGDGHYDFRMVTGQTSQTVLVPPYYGCFDPWLCEVASDNHYATVSGNDRLPDLAIGRITATNLDDATRIVAKIVDYERQAPAGAWRSSLAFVADNYRSAAGTPDGAGNFESFSETVIGQLPPAYSANRIYYDPYAADDAGESFRYRVPQAATTAILDRVNQGQLFVNYIGHAASNLWASEWLLVGKARDRNDVAQMANGPRLPIFVDMTCLSGNFADPGREALQETLLAHPGGGSVAGWAATGLGIANGHDVLHRGFYQALFGEGVARLGLVTMAAKQYLWAQTGAAHADLLDTFGLVGDPALDIPLSPVLLSQADR